MTEIKGGCLCGAVRYVVRAGTLDDQSLVTPQGAIWTASAPAWAHIDPNLPHFEGQPPAPHLSKR